MQMALYQILWVDDDWAGENGSEKKEFLNQSLKKIEDKLGQLANQIKWDFCHTVDRAVVKIQDSFNDFRIAIIDYKFGPEDSQFKEVLDHIRRKNIPYIIYSYFITDVKIHSDYMHEDELRIGLIPKHTDEGEVLAERITAFLKAPPFRLLHLSDLHYDSNAKNNELEAQNDLFRSLLDSLKEEHRKTKFDGIVITGDFSSKNPVMDLIEVRSIIQELVEITIGFDNVDRLFLIPGNHDIFWDDFEKGKISQKPWVPFLGFYQTVFNSQDKILKTLNAWDPSKRSFRNDAVNKDLLWNRKILNPPINFIGLITPSPTPDKKSIGHFDKKHEDFVLAKWETKPTFGEVRIAIMHHNLFAALSLSPYDEKDILRKSGNALYSLIFRNCNIVLNGHTHSPNVYSCSVGNFSSDGFGDLGQLIVSSTGNASGYHPSGDRARCFNILDFMDADKKTGARKLTVIPFIYESAHRKWVDKKPFQLKIL
jgi:3',5'-cyclic AMP phosphodiesterase CpdA